LAAFQKLTPLNLDDLHKPKVRFPLKINLSLKC
jgi:hypothetical protein